MPDGYSVIRGEINRRLCCKEAIDFTLSGILRREDLLIDLYELETLVVFVVHFKSSVFDIK